MQRVKFDVNPFVPDSTSTSQQVPLTVTSPELPIVNVPDTVDHVTVEAEKDAVVEETLARSLLR